MFDNDILSASFSHFFLLCLCVQTANKLLTVEHPTFWKIPLCACHNHSAWRLVLLYLKNVSSSPTTHFTLISARTITASIIYHASLVTYHRAVVPKLYLFHEPFHWKIRRCEPPSKHTSFPQPPGMYTSDTNSSVVSISVCLKSLNSTAEDIVGV